MSSRLQTFMRMAYSHKGEHGDWVWQNAPQDRGHAWCAAFVWTCAKLAGVGKVLIPYTYSARYMGKMTYENFNGQRFMSPAYGGSRNFSPRCGDLIFFRWTTAPGAEWWVANHVGIVVSTAGDTVTTIEGNRGGGSNFTSIIDERRCSKYWDKIVYYVRPAWTAEDYAGVGQDFAGGEDTPPWNEVFPITPAWGQVEPNTRNDMAVREVGYIHAGQLSAVKSRIPVSVVNYTSGLSELISATGIVPNYSASGDFSVGALRPVPRAIAQQLVTAGFSMGAAVGILGNIQRESDFRPDVVNSNGGASGLCQWYGDRCRDMKAFVGPDWKHNVTGQIQYLIHEVTNITFFRNKLYNFLRECPNSLQGAKTAADTFFHWYEALNTYTPAESARRVQFASELWAQLEPVMAPTNNLLEEFIQYLNEQARNHSIYVWGAQGQPNSAITRAWIKSRETSEDNYNKAVAYWQKQVAAGYGPVLRAFDCSGLGMYWLQNLKGILSYDHSAHDLYTKCTKISKDQLTKGDFVFKRSSSGRVTHVGYIVDNRRTVIEAKGRAYGVIKHAFVDSSWNAYGRPPFWTE